jgi:hypothetical protein
MMVQALSLPVTTNSDLLMVLLSDLFIFKIAFFDGARAKRWPIGAEAS